MVKSNNVKNANELTEKVVSVKKVCKTVKGGKNFSLTVLVVVGDKNGRISYGSASAKEVSQARVKAINEAKKSFIKIPLKEARTVHYEIMHKFCGAKVIINPAPEGTGIIAGGLMRAIFECLGVKDVVAKCHGSSNPYNLLYATFGALKSFFSPKSIAARRNKDISEIIKQRNLSLHKKIAN